MIIWDKKDSRLQHRAKEERRRKEERSKRSHRHTAGVIWSEPCKRRNEMLPDEKKKILKDSFGTFYSKKRQKYFPIKINQNRFKVVQHFRSQAKILLKLKIHLWNEITFKDSLTRI